MNIRLEPNLQNV